MTTAAESQLRYIDSDGHILEPPTGLLDYAPAAYRDRIWHLETDADGSEHVVWDQLRHPAIGLAGTAGFPDEKVEQVRAGEIPYIADPPVRLDRRATPPGHGHGRHRDVGALPDVDVGLAKPRDVDFGRVQARAYNEWCSAHLSEGRRAAVRGRGPSTHARGRRRRFCRRGDRPRG